MASEMVSLRVSVILASGLPAALAAKAATATVPIVFTMGADPVGLNVVHSLNRPGANITGVSQYFGALGAKRLELLRELLPKAGVVALLTNPSNPNAKSHLREVLQAGQAVGQRIEVFEAGNESEIDAAFEQFVRAGAAALFVADDPFFTLRRGQIVKLAVRAGVPAIYYTREFATAGGLLSYGSSTRENFRHAGIYVGKILRGAKPADLPILQPTVFELVINLKAAKAIGLDVPPALIARADEVIE
jgi:putative ABC transport system substrate-binding protein